MKNVALTFLAVDFINNNRKNFSLSHC